MNSKLLQRYLLAGLVVWLPIIVTIVVLRFIIELLDKTLSLIPNAYQPEYLLGIHIPGFGVVLSLALLLVTGILATNFFGQRFFVWGESILVKIPLVRPIYNTVKQVTHTILSTNSEAFRKVLLVEYPRKGLWSIGFQTGMVSTEVTVRTHLDMVSVFIPTTPNPTSGFLMMIPKKDVIELNISIDEALKYIISLGVMQASSTSTEIIY